MIVKHIIGKSVDPLASNKGFWAEVLGVGDFYYELAVQIVEICLATRSVNGGLMALPVSRGGGRGWMVGGSGGEDWGTAQDLDRFGAMDMCRGAWIGEESCHYKTYLL